MAVKVEDVDKIVETHAEELFKSIYEQTFSIAKQAQCGVAQVMRQSNYKELSLNIYKARAFRLLTDYSILERQDIEEQKKQLQSQIDAQKGAS